MKAIQLVILPRAMVTPPEDQPPPDNQPPPPPPPPQNQEQDPEDEKEEEEDEEDEEPPEDQEEEVLPRPAVQPAGGLKGRCMQTTVLRSLGPAMRSVLLRLAWVAKGPVKGS